MCDGQTDQELMSQLASEVFCIVFAVTAKPYLSTLTLAYSKVQSVHSHFTAYVTFSGDFSP